MSWSNTHTHSEFCDGKYPLENYATQATHLGMISLGFSSHAPLPFPCKWCMSSESVVDYLSTIQQLKYRFQGKIELYSGLEVDYIPDHMSPTHDQIQQMQLDYTIGSIHFLDFFHSGEPWEVDGSFSTFQKGLDEIFGGNIKQVVNKYYSLTREMIENHPPKVLGHMDKIKIHNRHAQIFDEQDPWYRREIASVLQSVKKSGVILEVNTRGIYTKKSPDLYPSTWILEQAHNKGIPITLNSDAHHPKDLIRLFPETSRRLLEIGFTNTKILKGGDWIDHPLTSGPCLTQFQQRP